MPTTKICSKCGEEKLLLDFHKEKQIDSGRKACCRECVLKRRREYRQTEKGKATKKQYNDKYLQRKDTKTAMRAVSLRLKFGLTIEDYNRMFGAQKGCCAICGKHQSGFKNALSVDHNHQTNKVRGLLCVKCNTKLSFIEDQKLLKNATAYLAKYATASQGENDVGRRKS